MLPIPLTDAGGVEDREAARVDAATSSNCFNLCVCINSIRIPRTGLSILVTLDLQHSKMAGKVVVLKVL